MAETLFNQFADEGALQAQRDFFLNEVLKPIKEGIKNLNLNIGTIDSSQSKRSVDELSRATDALDKGLMGIQQQMAQLNSTLREFVQNAGGAAKAQKDAATSTQAQAKSAGDAATEYQKLLAAFTEATLKAKEYQLTLGEGHQTTQEAIKDAAALGDKLTELNAAIKNQTAPVIARGQTADKKATEDAANDYLQLSKAYEIVALRAKNYQLSLGENHPVTQEAVKDAQNLDAALKKLNSSTKAPSVTNNAAALKAEQKIVEDAANDYLQLSKAYNEAALKAKNYVLRLGENHPIAQQAVKDANDIANTLKRLDASVGQNQRNVGNYASAVSGLGFSFTQVARELPSLAVNFQQFALAISNNLPYVADNLVRTRQEIAALKAEGKAAPSLFSAIGRSLFTWQVGLAVGITLFTVYAKQIGQFFAELFAGNDQLKKTAQLFKDINSEAAKNSGEDIAKLAVIKEKLNDLNKPAKERLEVLRSYNETAADTNKIDEAQIGNLQLINDKLTAQNRLILQRAISLAATAKLGETASKFIDAQLELDRLANKAGKSFDVILEEQENFNTKLRKQGANVGDVFGGLVDNNILKQMKAFYSKLSETEILSLDGIIKERNDAKKELESQTILLEPLINFEDDKKNKGGAAGRLKKKFLDFIHNLDLRIQIKLDFAEDNKNSIGERLKALRDAGELERQRLKQEAQFNIKEARDRAADEIEGAKGNAQKIATIKSNLNVEILNIQRKLNRDIEAEVYGSGKRVIKLQQEFYNDLIANISSGEKTAAELKAGYLEQRLKDAEKAFEEEKLQLTKNASEETKIIRAAYKRDLAQAGDSVLARTKAEAVYNEKRKELDRQLKKDLIQSEIDYTKVLLSEAKLRQAPEIEVKKLEAAIQKLQDSMNDLDFASFEELENKIKSIREKLDEALQSLRQLFVDAVKDIAGNIFDQQIQSIDALIQKNNDLKDATVKRIEAEQISEQDKAAKIQILNAETDRKNNQLEARRRNIETRKAQFEKQAALFQIGIDLAKALNKINLEAAATVNPAVKALILTQIPIAIASSAIQAAIVISKPIPKFSKGTQYSPEGVAEVAERGPELAVDPRGNVKVYEKHMLTYLTKGTKIYPADATKDILNAAEQDRMTLLKAFNNNVTISAPDHSAELKKQTKILERIEGKSRIAIINNTPIETQAWYQQHFKF